MTNFIPSFEEHLLTKLLTEGLHSFMTGTFNKKEAVKWLLEDGMKYITSYLLSHPKNNITKPFVELYQKNKVSSNGFTQSEGIDDSFLQALDHFKNTFSTRVSRAQPEGNVTSDDISIYDTWEDAENDLVGFDSQ